MRSWVSAGYHAGGVASDDDDSGLLEHAGRVRQEVDVRVFVAHDRDVVVEVVGHVFLLARAHQLEGHFVVWLFRRVPAGLHAQLPGHVHDLPARDADELPAAAREQLDDRGRQVVVVVPELAGEERGVEAALHALPAVDLDAVFVVVDASDAHERAAVRGGARVRLREDLGGRLAEVEHCVSTPCLSCSRTFSRSTWSS